MAVIRFDEMLYDRARRRSPINPPGGADVSLNNGTMAGAAPRNREIDPGRGTRAESFRV